MDEINIKEALEAASRAAQNHRDAHKNAAEIARLRAELAEARAELDDLRGAYRTRFQQLRDAERERDAARRERDERPEISREDAAQLVMSDADGTIHGGKTRMRRLIRALRAHAASAPPTPPQPDTNRRGYVHATTTPGPRHARAGEPPQVDARRCAKCNGNPKNQMDCRGNVFDCPFCNGTGHPKEGSNA